MNDLNSQADPTVTPPRFGLTRASLAAVVAVLGITTVLYWPRLWDFFLSDDFGFLWACWRPGGLFLNNGWITGDSVPVPTYFRFMPCSSLSGLLIYALSGLSPFGWHLANLLLHLANSMLVGLIVRRIVRSDWAGVAACAFFAVHYIHVEPVVWISGRTSLLVTFFMLAAIAVETRPRARRWGTARWIALAIAVLACLSKEDSIILPFMLLLVPSSPMTVSDTLRFEPRWLREELLALRSRIRALWPYFVLAGLYAITRMGAIVQATHEQAYRLEFGLNVAKNALFMFVANLFPVDFRATLQAWNRWYKDGDLSAALAFVLAHPGIIVGSVIAVLFWVAVLLWGNRAARRLTLVMIVAALPVLFFRGTGERLLYLASTGAAGVFAVILAGWHISFRENMGRIGRWIAPAMAVALILLHAVWLRDKQVNWQTASELSRTVVDAAVQLGGRLPANAVVQLSGLPDNTGGAWVFRSSIESAFKIYTGRLDVTVTEDVSDHPDSLTRPRQHYRWDGTAFVPME